MSDILNRAKQHYKDKLNNEIRTVEVPEWGDESGPLKIYVKPANLAIRDKIYKFASKGSLEALVETIILRAKDSDGLSLFTPADRKTFINDVDPDVIARVAGEISEDLIDITGEIEVGEAGKN